MTRWKGTRFIPPAGADYVTIEEGGATTISPLSFKSLLLPRLKKIFEVKTIPQALSLTGRSDQYLELVLECGPDALGVDQECRLDAILNRLPPDQPLFAVCGPTICWPRRDPTRSGGRSGPA